MFDARFCAAFVVGASDDTTTPFVLILITAPPVVTASPPGVTKVLPMLAPAVFAVKVPLPTAKVRGWVACDGDCGGCGCGDAATAGAAGAGAGEGVPT
jgi:hypothetical protein